MPALYQPTANELDELYRALASTPQAPFYDRARDILRDVSKNLRWELLAIGGWMIRSQSKKNEWYSINTNFEPPVCSCEAYMADPSKPNTAHIFLDGPVRPFLRRQCKHTIAFMGYRQILIDHCSKLPNGAVPRHIPLTMSQGQYKPVTSAALYRFALWLPLYLADPATVTRISLETWAPAHRHQM